MKGTNYDSPEEGWQERSQEGREEEDSEEEKVEWEWPGARRA
jgi:hypothetical protein